MRIIRRLIYFFFILLLFIGFVFFGGGRALIRIGEKMQGWELTMKENFGYFCQRGEKRIKEKAAKVTDAWTKNKDLGK